MTKTMRQLRPVWIFTKASSVPTCETEKREGVRKKYLEQTVRLSLGLRRFIVGEGRYWNRLSYFLGSTLRHELSPGQLQDHFGFVEGDGDRGRRQTLDVR